MWNVALILTVMYFFYVFLGAFIFLILESIYELNISSIVRFPKFKTSLNLSDMKVVLIRNGYKVEEIDNIVEAWDENAADRIFKNNTMSIHTSMWIYTNAFYLAFRLCATIGYGDLKPKTSNAQMLAVLYAIIGIPLNLLFFKLLGEAFAENYQETILRIQGEEESPKKKMYADLAFFVPWSLLFYLLPTIVFMFTEEWEPFEALYNSFITLSSVGVGDYMAGGGVVNITYYTLYKLIILVWIIYGLAFTTMIIDYITHLYEVNLLFEFCCNWRKCDLRFRRTYIDIEMLDIHFRLLRSEGVKNRQSIWSFRKVPILSFDFHIQHLANLAVLAEKMQAEILKLLEGYRYASEISAREIPKDAFTVKVKVQKRSSISL